MENVRDFKIWVDADACPKLVKEVIFKNAFRLNIEVVLVANSYLTVPLSPLIKMVKVDQGADVADFYIVEHITDCLLYTSPSPRDGLLSRMPSSA